MNSQFETKAGTLSRMFYALASLPILAGLLSVPQEASARSLEEARKSGAIIVGTSGDNPPFGFIDTSGEQKGYDADIARAFAKSLGLEVKFTNLSLAARIPSLVSQKVDIIISGLGITAERAKSVQFSAPYLETKMYVIAGKDKKITSAEDLTGVSVGVPRSSTIDTLLTAAAPKSTDLRRFDDDAANIQSLLSGQVEAIGANQFYSDRLSTIHPGVYENKFSIGSTWYGAATRPGEKDWNDAFNAFIFKFRTTKEFAEIYKTWVKNEVPQFPNSVDGVSFPTP